VKICNCVSGMDYTWHWVYELLDGTVHDIEKLLLYWHICVVLLFVLVN